MKIAFILLFAGAWCLSCNDMALRQGDQSLHKGLVPYAQRYAGSNVKDTSLPGGAYLRYFAGTDTLDTNLYILYGQPGFDSLYKEKDGVPFNCSSWEYAYHTPHVIGLMYECISGRQLLVLPLNARDSIRVYSPLYVSVEDSLLLVEDNQQRITGQPALIAADLDFQHRKAFQLSAAVPCADMLACFDTIYFNKKLVMEYEAGKEGQEPTTQVQAETIGWKK